MHVSDVGWGAISDVAFCTYLLLLHASQYKFDRPFDRVVWVAVFLVLASLSLSFLLAYHVYLGSARLHFLVHRRVEWKMDFFLYTFAAFVEPDPLPWFQRWSTGGWTILNINSFFFFWEKSDFFNCRPGRGLVLLWSFFGLMATSFYACNLRANLITPELEEPVRSAEDVVARDMRIFIPSPTPASLYFLYHPQKAYRDIYAISERKGGLFPLLGSLDFAEFRARWSLHSV